jgi:hypothetical protein
MCVLCLEFCLYKQVDSLIRNLMRNFGTASIGKTMQMQNLFYLMLNNLMWLAGF